MVLLSHTPRHSAICKKDYTAARANVERLAATPSDALMLKRPGADMSENVHPYGDSEGLTMRAKIALTFVAVLLAGCELADENPKWSPSQDYPSWAYDAPFYHRPSEDLPVSETIGSGIPVYYSSNISFFVKHCHGYQVLGVPRMALWCSTNAGTDWQRAGYFGAEQTHFLFQAAGDGPHWLRFVGPGQGIVQSPPGQPHRIYVVDTTPPQIELEVDPPPFEKDEHGEKVPHIYGAGEEVVVSWQVRDANLDPDSMYLATTFATFPDNVVWQKFPVNLEPSGQMRVPIPAEAAGRPGQRAPGGIRFRVEARDKAGNLGYAFTDILRVARAEGTTTEVELKPVGPADLISQTEGLPGDKLGWPEPGALIRGGTSRILNWLPAGAGKYGQLKLEFSANNARSWRTVAENIQPGKAVKWNVPQVNSRLCRLRIVGVRKPAEPMMLAQTQLFTVHTAPPDTDMGPKLIVPQ